MKTETETKSRLMATKVSLLSIIFCGPAEMTREEIQADIDRFHPSGTTAGWRLAEQDDNPVACGNGAENNHWLCHC